MNHIQLGILFLLIGTTTFGLPVQKPSEEKKPEEHKSEPEQSLESVLEYERYLKEVVEALESDPEFRKKLDKAPEADIRSGKIAQELDYVNHHVRSKLDEIKRREIERLRQLASKQFELSNDIDREHMKIPEHLDHENHHTFEIEDLKKLIFKTSQDLAEADRKRREEFKQYELQKEFEKQEIIKELDEEGRKKFENDLKKQKEKHNKHERVHHPGNQAQLEEVWEKQDHMDGQDFNPKVFFQMHDLDGNGVWDENEVKALFVKELDKVYQSGAPEDDIRERAEEMERMREHVFKESDTNHDNLISYQEFIEQTKREEFRQDPGWETVDNAPQFTHEEYLEYERKRQEEIQRLIQQGIIPSTPKIPNEYEIYHQKMMAQQQAAQNGQYQVQGAPHDSQAPYIHQLPPDTHHQQQYQQQMPQHQQQMPQYQQQMPQHQQQMPQHQQQMPQHQQQMPQHQQQMPQYQQQMPPHQQQMPQYQQQTPQHQQQKPPHQQQMPQYQQQQQQPSHPNNQQQENVQKQTYQQNNQHPQQQGFNQPMPQGVYNQQNQPPQALNQNSNHPNVNNPNSNQPQQQLNNNIPQNKPMEHNKV